MKKESDFCQISWDDYQGIVDKLTSEISLYIKSKKITFDFIVPILRGGGVLSISLSHNLGISRIFPVQYKYIYQGNEKNSYKPEKYLFSLSLIEDFNKEYNILITEGNHCTGQTAQICINEIKKILPNSNVYYASIGRDYSFKKSLDGTEYEWCGLYTNESETLTQDQCDELSIKNKFTIYPWENLQEELEEVNASIIYHNVEVLK